MVMLASFSPRVVVKIGRQDRVREEELAEWANREKEEVVEIESSKKLS
jgi:hypothetical protein